MINGKIVMTWSRNLVTWHGTQPHLSNSKIMNWAHPQNAITLRLMLDIRPTIDIRPTLENRPTPDVTSSALRIWKKPLVLWPWRTWTSNHSSWSMTVKLAGVIFTLPIELVGDTLALSMEVLAGVTLALLLEKPCAGGRAGRGYLHSINGSAGRCHPRITIEGH